MKKAVLWLLFLVGAIVLVLTFLGSRGPATHEAAESGLRYDSKAHTPVYERKELFKAPTKQFSASFQFQPYSTSGYSDLFQTAPLGRGARVELHDQIVALIVPANNAAKFDTYIITTSYNTKTAHTLNVSIDKENQVSASFDGQRVVDTSSPDLDYDISDITVGTGFLPERAFKGKIENFSYSYKLIPPIGSVSPLVVWVRIACAVVILLSLFLLISSGGLKMPQFLADAGETDGMPEHDQGALR